VRTNLSAFIRAWPLSACGRNEKLITTKARQSFRKEPMRHRSQIEHVESKTPFVLEERTGGVFSGTVALLRSRYLAASASRPSGRSRADLRLIPSRPIAFPGSNLFGVIRTHLKGAAMTQADHYRDQSNRARQLAEAVKDPEASKKLIEMAEEFRLYAERLEQTH
jgi:hypothetical protein